MPESHARPTQAAGSPSIIGEASALTFAEFFSGIGLVRLGLEREGWRGVFANDIDARKRLMYGHAFPDDPPEHLSPVNVHELDSRLIPSVTMATASFPCIDLSLAGNQAGLHGEDSGAFWGFVRVLRELNEQGRLPPLVMLENVVGWLSSGKGRDFPEAIAALNEVGYACDAFILDASYFTPQSRPRMFVVGSRRHPPEEHVAAALAQRSPLLRPERLARALVQNPELRWMVLPIPNPPSSDGRFADVVELVPSDDERWWDQTRLEHLLRQMSAKHRMTVEVLKHGDEVAYRTVYKRVRSEGTRAEVREDELAGCLRTPSGGSSKQIVIAAGQGEIKARWMTAREYARLQGVPDDYPIKVPYIRALWGFGDAVCVPAVSWIARHVLSKLVEVPVSAAREVRASAG
jgi:DNA (cytosine-5)-methyltransferase 1